MAEKLFAQSFYYVIMGGLVYLVDISSFTVIYWLSPDQHLLGNVAGKVVGAFAGFFLHKYVTFSWEQKEKGATQALRYIALLIANILFGTALLYLLVDLCELPAVPSRIFVDFAVIASAFLLSRNWVFRSAY